MCCVEGRIRHTSELGSSAPHVQQHIDWHNSRVSALMQNTVESGNTNTNTNTNTNASDGKTSHEINLQYSKLSRDVIIYPKQLQFLKNIKLKSQFDFETRCNLLLNTY
jgi:hypothetical protein